MIFLSEVFIIEPLTIAIDIFEDTFFELNRKIISFRLNPASKNAENISKSPPFSIDFNRMFISDWHKKV